MQAAVRRKRPELILKAVRLSYSTQRSHGALIHEKVTQISDSLYRYKPSCSRHIHHKSRIISNRKCSWDQKRQSMTCQIPVKRIPLRDSRSFMTISSTHTLSHQCQFNAIISCHPIHQKSLLHTPSSSFSSPVNTNTFHHLNFQTTNKNSILLCNPKHSHIQKRTKVFVSKHNQSLHITSSQIAEYCASRGIVNGDQSALRITPSHVILKECPFCPKPTMGKADNQYKLYVQIGGGAYFCHRCGASGSWYDFKKQFGGFNVVDARGDSAAGKGEKNDGYGTNRNGRGGPSNRNYGGRGGSTSMTRTGSPNHHNNAYENSVLPLPMPNPRQNAVYISNLLDYTTLSATESLEYLTNTRGLNKQTLRKYGVGLGKYRFPTNNASHKYGQRYKEVDCITFPWIMTAKEVQEQESLRGARYSFDDDRNNDKNNTKVEKRTKNTSKRDKSSNSSDSYITRRIKVRALEQKSWQKLEPPGGGWGFFGWHTVPSDATSVVITEGEYDAMAVYQATGRPSISLPNGCRSLPVHILPLLERFEKIYLWMDDDGPGMEGAEAFAKKIGINRCLIVRPCMSASPTLNKNINMEITQVENIDTENVEGECIMPKDANEALLHGFDLETMINNAGVVPHEGVLSFGDLRDQVLHEITNPDNYVGVPVKSLPGLTQLVKGFRRGEMTVLTGPTGSGKTTLLGQLSLDFAEQGVNTLWGSFEIKNTRLMHKLLQQFSRNPLPTVKKDDPNIKEAIESLEVIADRFQELPLYFMKFHGGSDIDDVLDAMDYAAYVHDVQHIILDNMQFMISRNANNGSTFDKFDCQDVAVEKFRKFATERNVHITLVVHPRKEDEGVRLGISSIYGSAKATQEADTVIILQADGRQKILEVKKNRFDGTLGICPLHFQRESGRYSNEGNSGIIPLKDLQNKNEGRSTHGNDILIRNIHPASPKIMSDLSKGFSTNIVAKPSSHNP